MDGIYNPIVTNCTLTLVLPVVIKIIVIIIVTKIVIISLTFPA